MKISSIINASFLLLLLPAFLFAQAEKRKSDAIYIQTSAQCDGCKETIEHAVKELKGVMNADLNLADKKVMVEYKPAKVSVNEIKVAISKAGYDADDILADSSAYADLPMCCKQSSK